MDLEHSSTEPGTVARAVGYGAAAAFCVLLGISMVLYPGGTWTDANTTSYRFFENFFCDLTHAHGLNGQPNAGSVFAQGALLAMAPGLGVFYLFLASRVPNPRGGAARFVRTCGYLAALGLLFVPLTPSDRTPWAHAAASLSASVAGLVALATFAVLVRKFPRRVLPAVVLLLMVAVDGGLYVQQLRTNGPTPLALPALQKIAALWLVGWMVVLFFPSRACLHTVDGTNAEQR